MCPSTPRCDAPCALGPRFPSFLCSGLCFLCPHVLARPRALPSEGRRHQPRRSAPRNRPVSDARCIWFYAWSPPFFGFRAARLTAVSLCPPAPPCSRVRCERPVPPGTRVEASPSAHPAWWGRGWRTGGSLPERVGCHPCLCRLLCSPPGLSWSEVHITINAFEQMHESRHVCLSQGCLVLLFWLPY